MEIARKCRPGFYRASAKKDRALAESLEHRLLLAAQPYTWQNADIGGGGFVDGIFFDPTNQSVIYARTDIGGLYKTTNGNAGDATRWQQLLDFADNSTSNGYQQMGVLAFAMDPHNTSTIYLENGMYSGNNGWLLRSSDGGQTFSQLRLPFYVGGNSNGRATGERLAVDPNLGTTLFVGSNDHGLYKSTDGGVSVSAVTTFPKTTADIDFVTFDPTTGTTGSATQTIYVGVDATSTGSNIYRSTNGGTSWSLLAGGGPSGSIPMRGVYASNGFMYFTYANALPPNGNLTSGSVWRYQISSGTWASISPQTPGGSNPTFGYDGIAIDPQNPTAVVVTSFDRYSGPDTIWRTANATVASPTWVQLFDPSSGQSSGFGGYNMTRDTSAAPWVAGFGDGIGNWAGSVAIDPFNSAHLLYGTGQGLWATDHGNSATKLTAANSWYFPDTGIEFTAVGGLVAPSTGVPLLSAMGDIFGFAHTTLTTSPAAGAGFYFGSGNSVDAAGSNPNFTAVVGSISTNNGAYSINDGATYTQFAARPANATGGTVAVTANGSTMTMVWAPSGQAAYWSTDHGTTWTASTGGLPTGGTIIADRVNPNDFYYYSENTDDNQLSVYISTDDGVSFTLASTTATGNSQLVASPYTAGDLWLTSYSGLWHSTNFGSSFALGSGVQSASLLALGKSAPGQSYAALYIWGTIGGVIGVYRSDDAGATWSRINDAAHQWGGLSQTMAADPNVFGRVYIGFNGRGIIMGNPVNSLPAGWLDADIKTPGNPGWATSSTTLSSGSVVNQWTINGGGAGILGSSDQFNFAYETVTGDYAAVAQLKSLTNAGGGIPQAGVMFRGGANANDPFAALLQTTGSQLVFETRAATGGTITSTTLGGVPIGAEYVEINRAGNNFSAFYSADGSHWTQLGSTVAIAAMPAAANAGLAVTANNNAQLSPTTFANVQVVLTSAITGNVFVDANGNGALDGGESTVSGVTVFLDANNNGSLDAGEISTTTTAGGYSFSGLLPGSFTVREVVPAGYVQSGPNPGASPAGAFNITAAGATYTGNNFGVFPIVFTGGAGNDNYYLRLDAGGTKLEIDLSSTALATPTYTIAKSLVPSLTFAGGAGADTFTVDFANGNPIPSGGVGVDGGAGGAASGDQLLVEGSNAGNVFSIDASQVTDTASGRSIGYANLKQVEFDLLGGNDALTQLAQPTAGVVFNGGTGSDTLNINAGSFAFSTDAGATSANLTVNATGAGSLVSFTGNQHLAALNLSSSATATISASASAALPAIMTAGNLTFTGAGAKLNLTNNELLATATLSSVRSQIIGGQLWTSIAGGLGSLDLGGGNVEVRFTLIGDTDLDGAVDVSDLGNLASNFGITSGGTWNAGDFDYNGTVDVADLGDLASNFGQSLGGGTVAAASISAESKVTGQPAVVVTTKPSAQSQPSPTPPFSQQPVWANAEGEGQDDLLDLIDSR